MTDCRGLLHNRGKKIRYKGIRRPVCLGGQGCNACWRIYQATQKKRAKK